jgi:hypothetical protein
MLPDIYSTAQQVYTRKDAVVSDLIRRIGTPPGWNW